MRTQSCFCYSKTAYVEANLLKGQECATLLHNIVTPQKINGHVCITVSLAPTSN